MIVTSMRIPWIRIWPCRYLRWSPPGGDPRDSAGRRWGRRDRDQKHQGKDEEKKAREISPNLRQWLSLEDQLHPRTNEKLDRMRKETGVNWAHNIMRHYFCQLSLAKHGSAEKHQSSLVTATLKCCLNTTGNWSQKRLQNGTGRSGEKNFQRYFFFLPKVMSLPIATGGRLRTALHNPAKGFDTLGR